MSKLKAALAATRSGENLRTKAPHLIIQALAGTGKTTTTVQGAIAAKGGDPTRIITPTGPVIIEPSSQQSDVWTSMIKASRIVRSITMVAFNKAIANTLQQRVPEGVTARTLHSLGNSAIFKSYGKIQLESFRTDNLLAECAGTSPWELKDNYPTAFINAVRTLVGLSKQCLLGYEMVTSDEGVVTYKPIEDYEWELELDELSSHYDVELNGQRDEIYRFVPEVLELAKDVKRDKQIDFNDMIWLVIANNLPVYVNDLLIVDEAQDLNRMQQALALRCGARLVLCGDTHQAIYGFAGADSESMSRMEALLGETSRGVEVLPLTVTRRCGKAIVVEAQQIVPQFRAHENNSEGTVKKNTMAGYVNQVKPGDMLLCRVNAPLVSECFKFIAQSRKATIQGRDIGKGMIALITRQRAGNIGELTERLEKWYEAECQRESRKLHPSESRMIALGDKYGCLQVFMEGASTIEDVIDSINKVFSSDNGDGDGILLSSIHRAKGLEADTVYLLEPDGATVPHPMAKSDWQREQEKNLRYVAITRAINTLVYVSN